MTTWIELTNSAQLSRIAFAEVDHANYKCKSVEITIQFKALKDIEANTHALKLEIDERRNPAVFFTNKKRRKYIPIKQNVNRGQLLKSVKLKLVSTLELNLLKISPRILFEYFFRVQKNVKYSYEGEFLSKSTD